MSDSHRSHRLVLYVAALLFAAAPRVVLAQTAVPDGFDDTPVASVSSPTALANTPDGRLLIASQLGQLYVYEHGALLSQPALDLSDVSCSYRERGLVGVAVDPEFALNHFIYVSYTVDIFSDCQAEYWMTPVSRVSRFVLSDANTVDRATERVLIDNVPSILGFHNLADVEFGKDGYLYISVGDSGCDYFGNSGCFAENDSARDMHALVGKILRVTRDGGIPPGNPFTGPGTVRCNAFSEAPPGSVCQEIFATGLRNPWRFAFDPNASGTRFFINDVGQDAWEEINEAVAGADYGWNRREGFCAMGSTTDCSSTPPPGLSNPVFSYGHSDGCGAVTGGAFVPNGKWPAQFDNVYLFGDYVCGAIFKLVPAAGSGFTRETFVTGLGHSSATDLYFGRDEDGIALYYTTYANGGEVRRIAYVGSGNRRPIARMMAAPSFGASPLAVDFDAAGSTDPDGDVLTYAWNFGDGTPAASGRTARHTYMVAGGYTARLVVRDPDEAASTATIRIDAGNTPPNPVITLPRAGDQFAVGDTILLQGSATDAEDGTLPLSSLTWRVLLHHNTHTHGFLSPTTGTNITFSAPGPENLEAAAVSYLELQLTAADTKGRATTVVQALRPRTAQMAFVSEPAGATLRIDNALVTAPSSFVSWVNYPVRVEAASHRGTDGAGLVFASWSDNGAEAHTIVTPPTPSSYTARFITEAAPASGRTASASSVENSVHSAANAIDGNAATRWSSAFSDPQWLAIDLGEVTDIDRVVLQWEAAYAAAYRIDVSDDGVGWRTVFQTTSGNGGTDDILGLAARGRFVRMFGTVRGTVWGYSLWEFHVFGDAATPTAGGSAPYGGTPVALPGKIQVEHFDEGGSGVAYLDTTSGNSGVSWARNTDVDVEVTADAGGGYDIGWLAPGEWLKYTVNVTAAGTYTLEFRVAAAGVGGTFHLEVNGVDKTGPLTIPNTGAWQAWTTVTKTGVTLAAGQQVWRLVIDSRGTVVGNINYIGVVGPAGGTPPPPPPPPPPTGSTPYGGTPAALPGTVQAEDFDNGGAGVAYHDLSPSNQGGQYRVNGVDVDIETSSDTGGGFNLGSVRAGEWLKYTVNVGAAGPYDIELRVASSGVGGTFHIEVDGVDKTGPLVVPYTGGWQSWSTLRTSGVSLSAGTQVWRVVMDANGATGGIGKFNWFRVTPATAPQIVRQPYLQQVTESSAIVVWTTAQPGAAEVRYGLPGGPTASSPADTRAFLSGQTGLGYDFYQHEARLVGLTAATRYTYDVFMAGRDATPGQDAFTTAPLTGAGTVRFIAFGDSGVGSTAQRQLSARMTADSFDLAIHSGDVAYGTADSLGGASYAQYDDWLFGVYAPWLRSRPLFPSIGNHDDEVDFGKPYRDVFVLPENGVSATYPDHAERYYSFNYGPVHFVALDTELAFRDPGRRQAQLAWLAADLAATSQPWRVAFFHRAPYSAGSHHGSDLEVRQAFAPLFEQYGVQLAIAGHEHDYERSVPWREFRPTGSRVVYVVTGGGGGALTPAGVGPWTAASASVHHYVRIAIDNCVLSGQAVRPDGTIFDSFAINRCTAVASQPLQPPSEPGIPGSRADLVLFAAAIVAASAAAGRARHGRKTS